MENLGNLEVYPLIKNKDINSNLKSQKTVDPIVFKDIFKSYIEIKRNNDIHKKYLGEMYLQSRDKYQKYVTNKNNSIGLSIEGNKKYENLPLNNFKNEYILNTINISKELEINVLKYIKPFDKKDLKQKIELLGEKMKLTPIIFKNNAFIKDKEERKKIQEIRRSAVFMRKVEYTHLINNFRTKNKSIKKRESKIMDNKIYILKGAILIIEDWWKKIKIQRKEKEKFSNKMNSCNNFDVHRKIKENKINHNSLEKIGKKNLLKNKSNQELKSNINNNKKKHISNSKNKENNNINNINLKLNNNFCDSKGRIIKKNYLNKYQILNNNGTNHKKSKNTKTVNINLNIESDDKILEKSYKGFDKSNKHKEQV